MSLLGELSYSFWLILAAVLLVIEILLGMGFFIGLAIAGVILAMISFFSPNLSWQIQLSLFAVSAIIATIGYWRLFKNFNNETDQPLLNNRMGQQIGRRWALTEDIVTGEGVQQIGGVVWKVRAKRGLSAGDLVEVYGVEGSVLLIQPAADES